MYMMWPRIAMTDFKTCLLQSISIDFLCMLLCSGSFPDKKRVDGDSLDSSFEASDRIKLVRLVTPYILLFI